MPTVTIHEHSGTNKAPDKSDKYEIPEGIDSSFSRSSYIQACPIHDRDKHRDLRQTKLLAESRELDLMHAMCRSVSCIRLFRV